MAVLFPYLAQLHKDVNDPQEVGGGKGSTGVTAGHVVFIQSALTLAQSTPAAEEEVHVGSHSVSQQQ